MLNIRKAISNEFYEVNQNSEKNEKMLSEMFMKINCLEKNINNLKKIRLSTINSKYDKNCNKIKVGIIYVCNEDNYPKLINITKGIIKTLNDYDYEINFIPFYDYINNDTEYYQKIIEDIKNDNLKLKKFPNNFQEIIDILNAQDIILSMRYHGTLLPGILNKKIINVI